MGCDVRVGCSTWDTLTWAELPVPTSRGVFLRCGGGAGSPGCFWVGATSPATDPPLSPQGNCYVWNLTGGIGEEVTQLIPKTKIPAHNRYALQCKFSPDST